MQYRKFGSTGVKISALGFGGMRLPEYEKNGKWVISEDKSIEMIHRAFELGVNYIDTAYGYCHGNSEYLVGKALKGYRDKVYLSTKMPTWNVKKKEDYRIFLEEQLKKLDVEYIDFYHFHGLNKQRWVDTVLRHNLIDEAQKAKQEGLIKHISFSFHDKPEVMKELIDVGIFESVLCQYNLLDRANEEAIEYALSKGLGTVIMGPVGGGRLGVPSEVLAKAVNNEIKSTPEMALRFVLSNKNVNCALSGMSSIQMVEENARVASIKDILSQEDKMRINSMVEETKKLADLYCTGCDYCMPCPKGIKISQVFSLMNYHKVYKITDYAVEAFGSIGKDEWSGTHPSECIECGECEKRCPQNIKIREQLKETIKELS
jgi:uncharacterized protein